jgi:hypothetical protein
MLSPQLPAAAALVVILVLLTVPTQIRMRNVPMLVVGIVVTCSGIIYLVNTLVWAGNVRDVAPIWCDIGRSSLKFSQTEVEHADHHYSNQPLVVWPIRRNRSISLRMYTP